MHPETRNQFLSAARPVVILEDRPCGPALRRNPWWPSTLSPNDFTPLMDLPQRLMASSHHCNRIRLQETAYKVGVKVWQRGEGLHASAGRKGAAAVWCDESSQFHVLTFFRGTVSSLKSPSGTAKALVLNSE